MSTKCWRWGTPRSRKSAWGKWAKRRIKADVTKLGEQRGEGWSFAEYQRDYLEDRAVRFRKVKVQAYAPDGVEEHVADTPAWPFSRMGMESLGHFAAGLQEMLLQSHEGAIRVFPATPACVEIASQRGGECALVLPAGATPPELVRYGGVRNAAPKRYAEATIGKSSEWRGRECRQA